MKTHITPSLARALLAEGPADIRPSYNAPWMGALTNVADMMQGTLLWVLAILLMCAGVGWVGSKLIKSSGGQHVSIMVLICCLIAAAIVGAAGAAITWATGINLFTV